MRRTPTFRPLDAHDQVAINELMYMFYSAFDNRSGRLPNNSALLEIFDPGARIIRITTGGAESWDLQGFLEPREALLTGGSLFDFHEWEIASETAGGDAIASRWSEYRKRGVLDGVEFSGGGRKVIQLYKHQSRWSISSILWEDTIQK